MVRVKASGEGKKRVLALFAFVGATLGMTAIAGLTQRALAPPPPPEQPLPKLRTPKEQKHLRDLIKQLRELGRQKDWKGVIATATKECPDMEACTSPVRSAYMEAQIRIGGRGMIEKFVAPILKSGDSNAAADVLAFLQKRGDYLKLVDNVLASVDPQKATAIEANNAAWAAVVMPGKPPQPEKVLALAKRGADLASPQERASFLNTLGLVQYRLGQYADAISTLNTTEKLHSEPLNWAFLAMAHMCAGHTEEAQRWASRYYKFIDDTFGLPERTRIEPLLFLREMKAFMPKDKN